MHPETEYYGRELSNMLGASPRSVHLELKNLKSIDLLQRRISGKQHYYSVNTLHPLYRDLQNIFRKTVGLKDVVAEALRPYTASIAYAFIYGSFASGNFTAESDVDLIIIGDTRSRKLSSVLMKAGESLEREINCSVFSRNEFIGRLQKHDHFISRILEEPVLFLVGDPDEFSQLSEKWMAPVS